jgi:hypothetical protein
MPSQNRTLQSFLCTLLAFGSAALAQPFPEDAPTGILHAFERYPIVAIGEAHSIREVGEFYDSLVKNRLVQQSVNDIVIEFAGQQSQSTLDRYVNGADVSPEDLRRVWRDTTKVIAWDSPIYAQFLDTVRKVNASLPPQKRLRVLAGDCWIDWKDVHNHRDWQSYQPNDRCFANVIEHQVLDKGRRALVILGGAHLSKNTDPNWPPNVTSLVERVHPHSMFIVLLSFKEPEKSVKEKPPILLDWPEIELPGGRKAIVGEYGDAMLYLSASLSPVVPDWSNVANDTTYLNELNRRSQIQWGCAFDLSRVQHHLPLCHGRTE